MGVVDRLNALDERAGARDALGARRWEGRLRLWWVPALAMLATVLVVLGLEVAGDFDGSAAVGIAVVPAAFYSGFLYDERLRALGRRPRLMEVPGWWPDPAPQAEPSPSQYDVPA